MATQPNAIPEGDDEPLVTPAEGEEEPQQPEGEQDEPSSDDDPIAKLAMDMGWVPEDRYTGPKEKWKPADQYIRDGRDIQRDQSRELRELRSTMDTVARTNAQILADRLEQQKEELTRQHAQAVEDGDADAALNITTRIHSLDEQARTVTQSGPPPEAQSWAEKNKSWFGENGDPLATRLAVKTAEEFKRYPVAKQLELAEREVRRVYPELFPANGSGKAPPGVNPPLSRQASQNRGPKGAKDLPPAALKVARDMHERGLIPSVESYATEYFKQEGQAR